MLLPIFQSLCGRGEVGEGDRTLILVGAMLQAVKLSPVTKIQESLIFLWLRPINEHTWLAMLLPQLLEILLCFSEDEFSMSGLSPPL